MLRAHNEDKGRNKEMRRLVYIVTFCLPLLLFGVAMAETSKPAPEPVAATGASKPLIKCSTCGVEFTTIKELEKHMMAHPEHKLVPMAGSQTQPLIKCSTCGVEFTTLKEAQEHIKTQPEHKLVPTAGSVTHPLIKCSTCGVEFTTLKGVEEHMKAHPEHKLVPEE
jgi:DNA-directed RNA polymerase subunit RPC12/RpoP